MTPIAPVGPYTTPFLPFRSQPVQETTGFVPEPDQTVSAESVSGSSPDPALFNQLPQGPVQLMLDYYRNINLLALQAAELDQTNENRLFLQEEISRDTSELRTIFDDLNRDQLELFVAFFENQVPGFSSNSNGNDSLFSGFFSETYSNNPLEDLLRIDVTSEIGLLSALDLSGSVIDSLSGFGSGSVFLESLLEFVGTVTPAVSVSDSPVPEPEEDSESPESDTEIVSEEEASPLAPGSDPPTIIDIIG